MLDMAMFRDNADAIRADHDRRGIPHDSIGEVIRLDEEWRKAQYAVAQLRRRRTEAARGKPQAGLPLLNGGSILGYLLSGALAIGLDNLWQDITF